MQFNVTFPNEIVDGKLERIFQFWNHPLFLFFWSQLKKFIDGTFKICPRPYYQWLIFMLIEEQTDAFIPVFHVLLMLRKQQIYRYALYLTKTTVSFKMQPPFFTCDYEKALFNHNAAKFLNTIINGCLFHWKQAICWKILELCFEEPIIDRFMHRSMLETLTIISRKDIEMCWNPMSVKLWTKLWTKIIWKKLNFFENISINFGCHHHPFFVDGIFIIRH